jgi:hypothetical protein
MIRIHFLKTAGRGLLVAVCWLGGAQRLSAQDAPDQPPRRFVYGGRIQYFPLRLFDTSSVTASTTKPIADYTYAGSAHTPRLEFLPSLEYHLLNHVTLGVELLFIHAEYQQITQTRTGTKDPNSSTDTRVPTTLTETTRANYWQLPILARYYGIRKKGLLSRVYVAGGVEFRHVAKIRTGNETSNSDSTTAYNEIPAKAAHTNQAGAVVGLGMRFVDELGVKVSPEVRLTRWQGPAFAGTAYRSTQNQLEVGLGFSF